MPKRKNKKKINWNFSQILILRLSNLVALSTSSLTSKGLIFFSCSFHFSRLAQLPPPQSIYHFTFFGIFCITLWRSSIDMPFWWQVVGANFSFTAQMNFCIYHWVFLVLPRKCAFLDLNSWIF